MGMASIEVAANSRALSKWKYQRIDSDVAPRKFRTVQFRDPNPNRKKKKGWRVRISKLKFRIVSPKTVLKRLRDAYINMMVSFSVKRANVGMLTRQQSRPGSLPTRYDQMSTKDLQRLYAAYLQRVSDEGGLVIKDSAPQLAY